MLYVIYAVIILATLGIALLPYRLLRVDPWYKTLTRPIGIWSLSVMLYWVWGSAIGLLTHEALNRPNADLRFAILAQLYFLLGACCLIIGYFSWQRSQASRGCHKAGYRWTSRQVVVLFLVLSTATLSYMPSTNYLAADAEAINAQIYYISNNILICVAWVVLFEKGRPRLLVFLALVLLLIGAFLSITRGSRSASLFYYAPGFILAVRMAGMVPQRKYLMFGGVLLLASLAVAQTVRTTYGVGSFRKHAETEGSEFIKSISSSLFDEKVISSGVDDLLNTLSTSRLAAVDNLAESIELAETSASWQFLWGQSMWTGFMSTLLPRFVYPEKGPINTAEDHFNAMRGIYYDSKTNADTLTNAPLEFYVNFGVIGVLFGMFFLGIIWRWLERLFVESKSRSTALWVCYLILCQSILVAEQEMHLYLFAMLRAVLIVLLLDWFLVSLKRRTAVS